MHFNKPILIHTPDIHYRLTLFCIQDYIFRKSKTGGDGSIDKREKARFFMFNLLNVIEIDVSNRKERNKFFLWGEKVDYRLNKML